MIWFGLVLWHINHCRLFNAKSSLYILNIYDLIWFGLVSWHINHCRLFNAKLIFMHVKTVLFQTIQFNISTQFECQNSCISNNPV